MPLNPVDRVSWVGRSVRPATSARTDWIRRDGNEVHGAAVGDHCGLMFCPRGWQSIDAPVFRSIVQGDSFPSRQRGEVRRVAVVANRSRCRLATRGLQVA